MFLSHKSEDGQQEKSRPVGRLPFRASPKCGLYYLDTPTAVDDDEAQSTASRPLSNQQDGVPASIAALQARVVQASLTSSAATADHFDVLSVSAACPVPCIDCALTVQVSSKTIAYNVQTSYDLTGFAETSAEASPPFAFLFPFSECGAGAESFQVLAGGQPLFGEMARVRRRDGRLIASSHRACFLAETSDMSDEEDDSHTSAPPPSGKQAMKLLYFFVVERTMLQFVVEDARRSGQTSLKVEVHWRQKLTPPVDSQRTEPLYIPFSYYCSPRTPDRITCTARFAEGTRILVVKSPNCRGPLTLHARVDGHAAEVQVQSIGVDGRRGDQSLAAHRHPEDYLWVFEFYFGAPPKTREDISVWAVTVVLVVAALIVWYILTKDLEL